MKNHITDLRNHLFAAIEGLSDKESPMDIERARAIADVAQTIINSARAENEYIKLTGATGSGFIAEKENPALPGKNVPRLIQGKAGGQA